MKYGKRFQEPAMTALRNPCTLGLAAFFCFSSLASADDIDVSARAFTVLQKHCFTCHGAAKTAGLDLRTSASAMKGGDHGPVIVPSQPQESRLYQVVSHSVKPFMPPDGKLSEAELDALRDWIATGASFTGFETPAPSGGSVAKLPDRADYSRGAQLLGVPAAEARGS